MNKVLIYSNNSRQSEIWAWQRRLHTRQIKHIYNKDQLQGLQRGTQIQLVGNYWERPDYIEFKHMAIMRGYILKEEADKDESNYTPSRPIRNLSRHVPEEQDTLCSSSL